MADRRCKNFDWCVRSEQQAEQHVASYEGMQVAVLMDIRDELQRLNGLIGCHNTTAIPGLLRRIARNTTKKRRKTA